MDVYMYIVYYIYIYNIHTYTYKIELRDKKSASHIYNWLFSDKIARIIQLGQEQSCQRIVLESAGYPHTKECLPYLTPYFNNQLKVDQ